MKKDVEIEVSARHIHLSCDDYDLLFGSETEFKQVRELSQRNEFATDKEVEIIGPKGSLVARFLSPFRKTTQVEMSQTDFFAIGINAPYEIEIADGGSEVTIKGEVAEITRTAAIIAKRHLHLSPREAKDLNLVADQQVSLEINTDRGQLTYKNITVKVADNFQMRVHLDTDEGNAAGVKGLTRGELIIEENDIST